MSIDENRVAVTSAETKKSHGRLPTMNLWRRMIVAVLRHLERGHLTLVFPEGNRAEFGVKSTNAPSVEVRIHNERTFRRLALGGHLALAECYMEGDWSCSDLTDLFELFLINTKSFRGIHLKGTTTRWLNRIMHWMNSNTKRGSKRNIAFHYDLGNAFYEQWLDPSMTYSSAYNYDGQMPLEVAQRQKNDRVLDLAGATTGHRILEIGCGWGGFAETAAQRGAHVHGITLSNEQLNYARQRSLSKGFSDNAKFELRDYRDTEGSYDHIVSIEMIEAVGKDNWDHYCSIIRDRLTEKGSAVIQAIVIEDARYEQYSKSVDFIQKYIFPGGMLPSPSILKDIISRCGLKLVHEEYFGHDYARTLAKWNESFMAAWPRISSMDFDERFKRMWQYYLAYCEAGFKAKSIDVGFYKVVRAF
ncbi:cyclopropane-fatty-acyl-phospholipid synthase [Pseudovibrio exalbescens]|uniref:SAM-dependent methyltransferase n=1 Tax=Pseudovibrio exalbescens TaxID=197461 RepID=UPI0023672973|nr:cyclopropane-fatty-acyl-phospholipid synthase family protein [Pseudovibrio exalbescens]MDD7911040.1 cyclopropane-fatty-acyl-phospholipid synthase [Pseudovibrio exalbescens]